MVAAALAKKAIDPVLIDVCGRASYADFIAVLSGRSDRQVDAIAEGSMRGHGGGRSAAARARRHARWALGTDRFWRCGGARLPPALREVFDIESLWIDAPRVKLHVPAENRGASPAEERPA